MQTISRQAVTAPTLFDGFPYFVFQRNEKGELPRNEEGEVLCVPWDSEYEHRRKLEEGVDFCVLPGKDRREKPWEEWKGLEQQNPPKCESCQEVFPDKQEFLAHLPCRPAAYYKLKRPGFFRQVEFVRWRGGVLLPEEVNWFRKIIFDSLSEDAFLEASKSLYFCSQLKLPKQNNKQENYKRYRVEWFFCLLFYVRPDDKLNPRLPNRQDWQDVLRIEKEFFHSDRTRQAELVREIFDPQTSLEEIAKAGQGRPPTIRLSPPDRDAIKDAAQAHLHGKKAAEFLTARGVKLDDGRTPKQLYDESPEEFYQWHRERKRIAGLLLGKPDKAQW